VTHLLPSSSQANLDTPLWNLDGISPFCHHAAAGSLKTKLEEAAPPAFDSVSSWMSAPLPFIAAKGAEEETAAQKNKKKEIAWGDASAPFFLAQTCAVSSSSSSSSMRGWEDRKELPLTPRFQEEGISKLMPEGYSVWQQKKDATELKNEGLPHLNNGEVSGVPKYIKDASHALGCVGTGDELFGGAQVHVSGVPKYITPEVEVSGVPKYIKDELFFPEYYEGGTLIVL